jgi:hypothetical protein
MEEIMTPNDQFRQRVQFDPSNPQSTGLGGIFGLLGGPKFGQGDLWPPRPQHPLQPPFYQDPWGIKPMGEQITGLEETLGGYGEQMGGFGETLGGYGEQLGGFEEQLGGFGQQMGGFGSQFKNINNKLTSLEKGIAGLTEKFGTNQQQQNVYQQPMMPSFGNLFSGGFNPYFYGGLGMLMGRQ